MHAGSGVGPGVREIAAAIALAAVSNMIVKLTIAVWARRGAFRRQVALALGSMAGAGAVAATIVYLRAR